MAALGCTAARSLETNLERTRPRSSSSEATTRKSFRWLLGGFRRDIDEDVTDLRATFRTTSGDQGIIVAILEVDNEDPDWDVNVDMEYVGVEGYTYARITSQPVIRSPARRAPPNAAPPESGVSRPRPAASAPASP